MPCILSLSEASDAIRRGGLSPLELLDACLDRIEALEPRVHAWAVLDPDGARAQAKALQEELARGRWRGPLHGIPIGIKDIIYTKGLRTEGGSKILRGFVPGFDATVVSRLREAGAVLPGKTVTTEFACYDPAETRNPWNPGHTPGGSSSGSAAAVACRMVPAALGSQTGGSISRPAAYCGIVGFKPTWGRVSVHGVLPVSFSLDHVGPLARSVADADLVYRAIAGPDPADPFCAEVPFAAGRGPVAPLSRPPRLGLLRAYFIETAHPAVRAATEAAVEALRSEGAEVRDVDLPPAFDDVHRMHRVLMVSEAAASHADRFQTRRDDYGPGIRSLIEEGMSLSAVAVAYAHRHQFVFRAEMLAALQGLDGFLTPAATVPAPEGLGSTGDPAFNAPWSHAGLPTVILPVGLSEAGLPLGIQFVGRAFAEFDLLAVARWCESRLGWSAAPELPPLRNV